MAMCVYPLLTAVAVGPVILYSVVQPHAMAGNPDNHRYPHSIMTLSLMRYFSTLGQRQNNFSKLSPLDLLSFRTTA